MNWLIIKDVIKDTDEQPDEVYRAKSGRLPSAGASVSLELGDMDVFTNPEAL